MRSPSTARARIGIVGAGPGGLTCARILQRHGIEVTVYDRDPAPDTRDQGGTLDLHADDGQLALREAGLLDAFFALSRPEGQEMRQLGTDGAVIARHVPDPDDRSRPEIDRGVLRDLLLDSLAPETVQWGKRLEAVTGGRELLFSDGSSVECDLVVGADGAFSRVRPAVSAAQPRYSGITFVEARFEDADIRHPEIAELVGKGSARAGDGDRAVFGQRNGNGRVFVYVMQRLPVDWIAAAGLHADDTAGIRAHLLDAFAGWSPRMRQILTDNDGPFIDRPLFVLPVPHTWEHNPSVTLLGDAAHLMPPVGVGVNLAMLDAGELALALAGSATVDDAVTAYEATMLPRSASFAAATAEGPEHLLSATGREPVAAG